MQRSLHDYLTGGPVRGPGTATSDSILARLSNGEYVLPKVAVDQVGVQNLEAIRRAALAKTPKLALGGPISGGLNFQSEEPTSTTFYPSGLPTASAPSFGDAIGGTNTGIKLGGSPAATPPGSLNSYGNDMSLANRMNAGAEAMRTMREGSAAPPAKPADDFATTLAKALQANDPAKQADEARKAAQAKADPLDVASGRFDREYAPGMAAGGLISQAQWERLPRFAEGWDGGYQNMVDPETRRRLQAESMQRIDSGFKALTSEQAPVYSPRYGAGATPAPTTPRVPATAQPPAQSAPPAPGATTLPPAPSAQAGAVPPPSFTPAVGFGKGTNFDVPAKPSTPATPKLPPAKETAQIYAEKTGGALLNNAPGPGIGPQAVVAAPSRPIGTQSYTTGQPFEPSQGTAPPPPLMGSQRIMSGNGVTGPVTTGGSNVPIYQTDYTVFGPKGQQGTLSVTGPDQRVGGGTVSQPDQGNGGTVEGNVAALNRQIDALRSLREARNPGITTGGSALPAAPAPVDMWARPGDSFGDSQMRQARYEGLLKDAANQKGLGAKRRAAAMIDAATGLLAPGAATAKLNAEQQQAANSLTGQLAQARAQQEASKYGADVGLAGHKYTADASLAGARLKAEQEAQQSKTKNDIDLANAISARISATARNALPAEKQMLLQLVDAYSKLDPKSKEAQQLKLLIDALNPPRDQAQAALIDEMARRNAAQ